MNILPVVCNLLSGRLSSSRSTVRQKRPFALAEVCVAMIIVGICVSYAFSSLQQTIRRYTILRHEICCHELADEYLARFIASLLTSPSDFTTTVDGAEALVYEKGYAVHMTTTECDSTPKDEQPAAGDIKEPAALVTLSVTVHPVENDRIVAVRSTNLFFTQGGI